MSSTSTGAVRAACVEALEVPVDERAGRAAGSRACSWAICSRSSGGTRRRAPARAGRRAPGVGRRRAAALVRRARLAAAAAAPGPRRTSSAARAPRRWRSRTRRSAVAGRGAARCGARSAASGRLGARPQAVGVALGLRHRRSPAARRPRRRRGGALVRQRGRQHDRPLLAVDADDQLEPDLLERDVALLGERQRRGAASAPRRSSVSSLRDAVVQHARAASSSANTASPRRSSISRPDHLLLEVRRAQDGHGGEAPTRRAPAAPAGARARRRSRCRPPRRGTRG